MRAIILTLFPDMFPGPLGFSLAGKALEKGLWALEALDIRSFAQDKHKTVDDSPYGGGVGMIMKPDVIDAAVEAAKKRLAASGQRPVIIYTTPRGVPFNQSLAQELISPAANDQSPAALIILCGRFEGVDQRVIDHHGMLEVSLGDFVLSGGDIVAMAILDACVRLLPGVIGKEEAIEQESFSTSSEYAGLLEYPHYTRPPIWKDKAVPDVLLSGNHEEINAWRMDQAKKITAARRPDLMKKKEE
jgi:tRNA (guanine37-N1)-methyltransferase